MLILKLENAAPKPIGGIPIFNAVHGLYVIKLIAYDFIGTSLLACIGLPVLSAQILRNIAVHAFLNAVTK